MNQRIKELALQAGFDVYGWNENELEKFAELIMRECFKAAMIESKGHMNPARLLNRMKERIGVE